MRPEILACAALHHWAYRAATGATPSTSDADALLHRTAWLVTGEPRPSGATWPELPTYDLLLPATMSRHVDTPQRVTISDQPR